MTRFRLSAEPVDIAFEQGELADNSAGGIATFEGRVRSHHQGKSVVGLDYEAYEPLALREGQTILTEARQRYDILHARCVHRTGSLAIGELAVWIGVSAAHRDAAFRACRYIIDELKARLPVWKREHYADGEIAWVHCHAHHPSSDESAYYARQTALPELGREGQEKLRQARVLVVGAGGLGSPALLYLAGAGVGTLGICEPDTLQISNLHRQIIYGYDDIGLPKALVATRRLQALNPFIQVIPHTMPLKPDNAEALLSRYDLVLDCTDNHATRFLLNDMAYRTGTPLIQASVYQYEGQVQLILPGKGSPCLRCLWPEIPEESQGTVCAEAGVLGMVPGMLGTLQAAEAVKLLIGLPTPLTDHLLIFDLLRYESRLLKRSPSPNCPTCGTLAPLSPKVKPEPLSVGSLVVDLTPGLLAQFTLIDIREAQEQVATPSPQVTLSIPLSQWDSSSLPDTEKTYLLICDYGLRSLQLARRLRAKGWPNVFALRNGLSGLKQARDFMEAAP